MTWTGGRWSSVRRLAGQTAAPRWPAGWLGPPVVVRIAAMHAVWWHDGLLRPQQGRQRGQHLLPRQRQQQRQQQAGSRATCSH